MTSKLLLFAAVILTRPATAATCWETPPEVTPRVTLSWAESPKELGQLAVRIGRVTRTIVQSCPFAQPYACQMDGDLGNFTLVPDGQKLSLSVRDGHLGLKADDNRQIRRRELEAAVIPGAPTSYPMLPAKPEVCLKRFGGPSPTLTFP